MNHNKITNESPTKIIGLCGKSGAGKTVIEKVFQETHDNVFFIKYADALKDCCSAIFMWPRELLDSVDRESPDAWWSNQLNREFSPRRALQEIGTDVFRAWHKDIWVHIVERKLQAALETRERGSLIVVGDCRFPNEVDLVRKYGGRIIHVERPELQCSSKHAHQSEQALAAVTDYEYKIVNNIHKAEYKKMLFAQDYSFIEQNTALEDFCTFLK